MSEQGRPEVTLTKECRECGNVYELPDLDEHAPPPKEQTADDDKLVDALVRHAYGDMYTRPLQAAEMAPHNPLACDKEPCAECAADPRLEGAESKAPEYLPSYVEAFNPQQYDEWKADRELHVRALSDLAAATRKAEHRLRELLTALGQVEHLRARLDDQIKRADVAERNLHAAHAQLAPNPRCTKGPHPLACADRTDPEGRCLWCADIERVEGTREELETMRAVARLEQVRAEAAEARIKEMEGIVLTGLRAFTTVERERDAYKKAKEENDERFMTERDVARRERDDALAKLEESEKRASDYEERAKEDFSRWYAMHREAQEAADQEADKLRAENGRLRVALEKIEALAKERAVKTAPYPSHVEGICTLARAALDEGKEGA